MSHIDFVEQMDTDNRAALLTEARHGDVRCFPSRFTVTWGALKLVALAFIVLVFTIILTSTSSHRPSASSAVMVAGSSLTIFILIVANMVHKEARRDYEKAVADGKWQEGVFVFSTKDVVVRFSRPFFNVEQEFPADSISLIQGNDKDRVVYILWTDALGHKVTFNVDCSRLVEKPGYIAHEMNRLLGIQVPQPAHNIVTSMSSSDGFLSQPGVEV